MPRTTEHYKAFRNQFKPEGIKLIFLLESPPANGGYFYDTSDVANQFLFKAMMQLVSFEYQNPLTPIIKEQGLRRFQSCGCLLMDATYTPVNQLNNGDRNLLILANYPNLFADLQANCSGSNRIIIVKTT